QPPLGRVVDLAQGRCSRTAGQRALQRAPGCERRLKQFAECRRGEQLRKRSDVLLQSLERGATQRFGAFRLDARDSEYVQLDESLRKHAQLAGTIDGLGAARGIDQALRDLANA